MPYPGYIPLVYVDKSDAYYELTSLTLLFGWAHPDACKYAASR